MYISHSVTLLEYPSVFFPDVLLSLLSFLDLCSGALTAILWFSNLLNLYSLEYSMEYSIIPNIYYFILCSISFYSKYLFFHSKYINRTPTPHETDVCLKLFASYKMPNDAVTPQSLTVIIILVDDQINEYDWALWCHSIVWHLLGHKLQNLMILWPSISLSFYCSQCLHCFQLFLVEFSCPSWYFRIF